MNSTYITAARATLSSAGLSNPDELDEAVVDFIIGIAASNDDLTALDTDLAVYIPGWAALPSDRRAEVCKMLNNIEATAASLTTPSDPDSGGSALLDMPSTDKPVLPSSSGAGLDSSSASACKKGLVTHATKPRSSAREKPASASIGGGNSGLAADGKENRLTRAMAGDVADSFWGGEAEAALTAPDGTQIEFHLNGGSNGTGPRSAADALARSAPAGSRERTAVGGAGYSASAAGGAGTADARRRAGDSAAAMSMRGGGDTALRPSAVFSGGKGSSVAAAASGAAGAARHSSSAGGAGAARPHAKSALSQAAAVDALSALVGGTVSHAVLKHALSAKGNNVDEAALWVIEGGAAADFAAAQAAAAKRAAAAAAAAAASAEEDRAVKAALLARFDERPDDSDKRHRPMLPKEMMAAQPKRVVRYVDGRQVVVGRNEKYIVEAAEESPAPAAASIIKIKKKGQGGTSPGFR